MGIIEEFLINMNLFVVFWFHVEITLPGLEVVDHTGLGIDLLDYFSEAVFVFLIHGFFQFVSHKDDVILAIMGTTFQLLLFQTQMRLINPIKFCTLLLKEFLTNLTKVLHLTRLKLLLAITILFCTIILLNQSFNLGIRG